MISLSKFNGCMDRAMKIRTLIKQILSKMTLFGKQLTDLNKLVLKGGEEKKEQVFEIYAATPKNAASGCALIRKRFPFKKNGYYWIKAKCMPEPLRVYCDFTDYNPNFYVLIGFHANKVCMFTIEIRTRIG
jgi:hypothetical protein